MSLSLAFLWSLVLEVEIQTRDDIIRFFVRMTWEGDPLIP